MIWMPLNMCYFDFALNEYFWLIKFLFFFFFFTFSDLIKFLLFFFSFFFTLLLTGKKNKKTKKEIVRILFSDYSLLPNQNSLHRSRWLSSPVSLPCNQFVLLSYTFVKLRDFLLVLQPSKDDDDGDHDDDDNGDNDDDDDDNDNDNNDDDDTATDLSVIGGHA